MSFKISKAVLIGHIQLHPQFDQFGIIVLVVINECFQFLISLCLKDGKDKLVTQQVKEENKYQ